MKAWLKKTAWYEWGLIGLAFVIMFAWSLTADFQGGPDEEMRYEVAQYIYEHNGALPRGDEESLLHGIWGISYAFYPVLSYMISALFMGIAGIFCDSEEVLLHAARMADVCIMTVAAWYVLQIGKKIFGNAKGLFFSILVIFLPNFLFLGTYVNNDCLALLAASIILYSWVSVLQEGWTWKNCVILAVGMGICFLSYFNAYGWILCSFLFFCISIFVCGEGTKKERFRFMMQRGLGIAGITAGIAGWWFIRNAILYNGDFLGRKACSACAEANAIEGYKPSDHWTAQKAGWSLKDMFIYHDPGLPHNFLVTSVISFIGVFGVFNIYMEESLSKLYVGFLVIGLMGVFWMLHEFLPYKSQTVLCRKREAGKFIVEKRIEIVKEFDIVNIFHLFMLGTILIPLVLFIYYSYASDMQPQGRYLMPALYPVIYFAVSGFGKLFENFVMSKRVECWFYRLAGILWIMGSIFVYMTVVVPAYR